MPRYAETLGIRRTSQSNDRQVLPTPMMAHIKANASATVAGDRCVRRCAWPHEYFDPTGILEGCRYLIHDRDTKFTDSFRAIVKSSHVDPLKLPARSPNLNAYAERWVKSVKEEALSKLILFGEASVRRALSEYLVHFHRERNHQGKGNVLLFPAATQAKNRVDGSVGCTERLGGLLKYYHRNAA